MIDIIYNELFILGNEVIFYTFLGVISLIILITIILVIKEVRNAHK